MALAAGLALLGAAVVVHVGTHLAVVRDWTATFEEHDDTSDIIDGIFFTLPSRYRLFDDGAARALQVIAMPEGHNQVDDLLVREELPHAVRGQNEELVLIIRLEFLDFCGTQR